MFKKLGRCEKCKSFEFIIVFDEYNIGKLKCKFCGNLIEQIKVSDLESKIESVDCPTCIHYRTNSFACANCVTYDNYKCISK